MVARQESLLGNQTSTKEKQRKQHDRSEDFAGKLALESARQERNPESDCEVARDGGDRRHHDFRGG